MIKNVASLKTKAKQYANKVGLTNQQILEYYMFESFLERLSYSEYKEKFILKVGCLLEQQEILMRML
jgi:hypothetical protein